MDIFVPKLRSMYIDMMVRILTNTIYEDSSISPFSSPEYEASKRQTGLDWPQAAHTMVGVERLKNLAELTSRVLEAKIPGDLIETGVWRGGCCILMRSILSLYEDAERRIFVADSFEGLPPPKPDIYAADEGDQHHIYKELAVSLEQVRSNFARYGLLDDQVVFVKGFFSDTLPTLKWNRFSLLRLDGDMYESTYCALDCLYPLLSRGGYIIIDDFGAVPACQKAVDDYRTAHGIIDPMTTVDWTGVWWQKTQ